MDGKPLSFEEATQYLGFKRAYLYKLVHWGKITYYKPTGGRLYFLKEDLDAFIRSGKRAADYELRAQADQILNSPHRSRARKAREAIA